MTDSQDTNKQQQEPGAWRELCRRLYVELYHCDQQMMATRDEDGEPVWTQGKTVRDVLADAKAALETSPPNVPTARASKPWVHATTWRGLTDEDDLDWEDGGSLKDLVKAIEAKLKEKNA